MVGYILEEGVLMYSFSDNSGCTFLHPMTGETLSVNLTESELTDLTVSYQNSTTSKQNLLIVRSLFNKGFIQL